MTTRGHRVFDLEKDWICLAADASTFYSSIGERRWCFRGTEGNAYLPAFARMDGRTDGALFGRGANSPAALLWDPVWGR